MSLVLETTIGDLTIDLFTNERPRACQNFLKLCKIKYYNYNLFHTIDRDFIAQTGDPTGVGDGGLSIWGVVEGPHKRYFEAESHPKIRHSVPGLLSMVSVGGNMIGSQFFITLGADLVSLDSQHCVIGEIVDGRDVLIKLNEAICDKKYRPYQDVRITHTVVLDDPFDDPRHMHVPSRSPSPTAERLMNGRIAADEDIDDTEGKTAVEIQEMLQEREAKARATILEIVGDLPDADIAPPENVLFVCKLNPVTTDDDLEIIFSRFGKVKTCEVIRDRVSNESLQYAFVEFEETKSCEQAFFKMDNVLIDDRRIHVDFSQSVAKIKWRGKGRGVWNEDGSKANAKISFDGLKESNHQKRDGWQRNDNSRRSGHEFPDHRDRRGGNGNARGGIRQNDRRDSNYESHNANNRRDKDNLSEYDRRSGGRERDQGRTHNRDDRRGYREERKGYRDEKPCNRDENKKEFRDGRKDYGHRDNKRDRSRSPTRNSHQMSNRGRAREESPRLNRSKDRFVDKNLDKSSEKESRKARNNDGEKRKKHRQRQPSSEDEHAKHKDKKSKHKKNKKRSKRQKSSSSESESSESSS